MDQAEPDVLAYMSFTRLAAALDQQRASVWLTHVDPSEVFTKR